MSNDGAEPADYSLDEIDRGVLFALQRDARHVTAKEIAAEVEVSPSTVRNRISNMEELGIIEGYVPVINYERAGYQLRVMFVATVPGAERSRVAKQLLSIDGVVDVRETLTDRRNLFVEVVATTTSDLTRTTAKLNELPLELVSSAIIVSHRSQPLGEVES